MKKLLLFGALAFGLNALGQVPTYVPTNGLIAYWPFEGNADDASGNGTDGVVTNATLTTDQYGTQNSAYNFDYSNYTVGNMDDIIQVFFSNWMQTTELSVSLWFKPTDWSFNGNSGVSNILNRMRNTGFSPPEEMWSIIIEDSGVLKVRMSDFTKEVATPAGTIALNNWYHVIFTYDNAELKLYLNGTLVGTTAGQNLISSTATNDISFGVSSQTDGYLNPYNGVIDNTGMWNRALSQCEVTELYTGQDCTLDVAAVNDNENKELVKIIDLMGRETEFKSNTPLIFIYSDGSREQVMKLEE